MSYVWKLSEAGFITLILAVAILLPAQAQTCAERKSRLEQYYKEADSARRKVAELTKLPSLAIVDLKFRLAEDHAAIKEGGAPDAIRAAQRDADFVSTLIDMKTADLMPSGIEHPALQYWERRRDEIATNLSHGQAAMESMHCEEPVAKQPGWAGGSGGIAGELTDKPAGDTAGENFCCQMGDPKGQEFSCADMKEPARCSENSGKIVHGSTCNMGICSGGH
jgi:hypothetical protein